jgi:hypothetical protein
MGYGGKVALKTRPYLVDAIHLYGLGGRQVFKWSLSLRSQRSQR